MSDEQEGRLVAFFIGVGILIWIFRAVLRAADKFVHESDNIKASGVVPF